MKRWMISRRRSCGLRLFGPWGPTFLRAVALGPPGFFLLSFNGLSRLVKRSWNGRVGAWLRGRFGYLYRHNEIDAASFESARSFVVCSYFSSKSCSSFNVPASGICVSSSCWLMLRYIYVRRTMWERNLHLLMSRWKRFHVNHLQKLYMFFLFVVERVQQHEEPHRRC